MTNQLFSSKYINIHIIKGFILGVAKADDDYALMLGFIVIEFKKQYTIEPKRRTFEGTHSGKATIL
jgi:hypothetical protein